MPWSREHKSQTRTRILDAAAAEFRARGMAAVAVSDVMDRAGLTHGGFYAHFSSKDDLAAQALLHASAQTTAAFDRTATAADDAGRLQAVIDLYLHPAHLAHPERGCAVAALGTEAVRGGRSVRRSLSVGIRARLDRLRRLLPGSDSRRVRDQKAAGVFACMVGGLILARGLGQEEGDRLLADCRAFLRSALADSPH
jgi:TetR/AcrR family transcriptional regulator, transcriptional repressor for nem operon